MNKGKRIFTFPVVAGLLVLFVPMIASFLKKDNKPNLVGQVISDEKPVLSRSTWFSREYQDERDEYNSDHWAFKEGMVRLNNQLYYELFHQIRVKGFVIGKNDYLFSELYIYSAFGDDLLPESNIVSKLQKAKVVQDTLKKKGIDLLLVFAPGKGVNCREFVPDKYVHPFKLTNHDLYVKNCKQLGLNTLDLYSYFEKIKSTSPYPLFTKFGHHWSFYGEFIAVDSLIHHIENLHGVDMPEMYSSGLAVIDSSRSRDADVLTSMNLWKNPKQGIKYAYQDVMFENDPKKNTTSVLTIGDSYWYGAVYMGVPQQCFAGGKFWYYYNRVVPGIKGEKLEAWQLDLKSEIESNGVIMLMFSDGNLLNYGSGFIEDAYELYTSPATYYQRANTKKNINVLAKQIRESPLLLKKATKNSEQLGISLDSAIVLDARRMAGLQ